MLSYIFEESIGKLSQEVSKGLGMLLEKDFSANGLKLKSREWVVLAYLYHYEKVSQKDLIVPLGKDKVAIKRIIDDLEKKKWVKRVSSKMDKRFNYIHLTQIGKDIYKQLVPLVESSMQKALGNIDADELKICLKVMLSINSNIKMHLPAE